MGKIERHLRRKMTKFERTADSKDKKAHALRGAGIYVYRSRKADLTLPKPHFGGTNKVRPNQEFQGDDYFMGLVEEHELILVKVIKSAEQERMENMTAEKLLVDQPERVTSEGTVESVVVPAKKKPLNESQPQTDAKAPEVLLTEDPVEGLEIII